MSAGDTDRELLARARCEPEALELLYRRHIRRVMAFAARRCQNPDDVADLVSDTFVAVLESADRYDATRGEVLPWMLGIAHHLACDVARGAQRERTSLARIAGVRTLDSDEICDLEERIDAARSRDAVEAAMNRLSRGEREVLWLVGGDGLAPAEAAQVLRISPVAFRMRLMRARRALKRSLATHTPSHGGDPGFGEAHP